MIRIQRTLHAKARQANYPKSKVQRFAVPDEKVDWKVEWPDYDPVDYTAPRILERPPYADIEIRHEDVKNYPKFNTIDGNVDRRSNFGNYEIVDNVPRNPAGRTGIKGRGVLGRWGPNHAADPTATRWKRDSNGNIVEIKNKKVLEFVAIRRQDNGQWALPGGMVEPGDTVTATLRKEFGEEALNTIEASKAEKKEIEKMLQLLFNSGIMIYKGYVDDPRNTDNSWMETTVVNFHDDKGSSFRHFNLKAGDDAGDVAWLTADRDLELYANHSDFIKAVAELHKAHF